ncbi:MAG: hypothetical protein AAGB02_06755 [Pseudomonadota bacterium]
MKKRLAFALFAAGLATTACSSVDKAAREANPAPCPNTIVLADAANLVEFDGGQTAEDVAFTGEIVNISSACRYFGDKPIEAEIELELAFGKGPKGGADEKIYKYFVAVTRTNLEVIAKREFLVPVEFSESRRVVVTKEDIDKIEIPRASEETSGLNFEIVVGFVLTPQQAIYNRSGKSLKFPDI